MPSLMKRPIRAPFLADLQDEINQLFDFTWPRSTQERAKLIQRGEWAPAIDIKDEKDHYLITADIPGVDPKNIEVTMNNGVLTIRGERETETEEKKENYVRTERSKGIFYRHFTLPESVEPDKIKAKSKLGVLEITIPKAKGAAMKKITVES
jgi:HSP20 family protein